jgi:hypothetical protein
MALLSLTRAWAALVFVLGSVCSPFAQISQSAPEHEIKAAFLFNFTKFVTWPTLAANQPFRVCVAADDITTTAIGQVMKDEVILGRKAETLVIAAPEEARTCQVLFLGRSATSRAAAMLAAVRSSPVLTVGDSADFLDRGGIIQFVLEESRLRFDVDLTHATRAQLSINARMLRVARQVRGTR